MHVVQQSPFSWRARANKCFILPKAINTHNQQWLFLGMSALLQQRSLACYSIYSHHCLNSSSSSSYIASCINYHYFMAWLRTTDETTRAISYYKNPGAVCILVQPGSLVFLQHKTFRLLFFWWQDSSAGSTMFVCVLWVNCSA